MIEDILLKYADLGFAYAVSAFLLWKCWKQDKEYLTVLVQLKDLLEKHIEQKDAAIQLLREGAKR